MDNNTKPAGKAHDMSDMAKLRDKVFDLAERCEKNCVPVFTKFLRAEELAYITDAVKSSVYRGSFAVYGGFKDSERKVAAFFPDYLYESAALAPHDYFPITAVKISGSGYKSLSHRDFLGSVLSLGINREAVGDIFVCDEKYGYMALLDTVAELIVSDLETVGRDKVKCEIIPLADLPVIEHNFEEISTTVASLRLDAVLSCTLGISRDKAEKLIATGDVSVNHIEVTEKSKELCEGDLLSVRTKGRFLLYEAGGLSKKGRTKITVKRYI